MERIDSKQWVNSLKIAIINEDYEKLEIYSKREIPKFDNIAQAKEALNLVEQAKKLLNLKKNEISKKMNALKQTKKYNNLYSNNSTNNWIV